MKCEKQGLECGGYEQKLIFKIYDQGTSPPTDRRLFHSGTVNFDSNHEGRKEYRLGDADSLELMDCAYSEASTEVTARSLDWGQAPSLTTSRLLCRETGYYSHFLGAVSSILVVWDAPYNSNPYRFSLPSLANSSWGLTESMKALGALHLANTSDGENRRSHLQSAMTMYGAIIRDIRDRSATGLTSLGLPDMATNLLLCLFEVSSHPFVEALAKIAADDEFSDRGLEGPSSWCE